MNARRIDSPATARPADAPAEASNDRFDAEAGAQMECLVRDLGRMYRERNEALREVVTAHHDALFRLALAADYRDDDTGLHIVRLGFLAERLALVLGQGRAWAEMLRKAAPMHDVGKIGIPDAVLKKPGPFTDEERAIMNRHSEIGAQILGKSRIPLFQLAAEVALTHHERFDGSGYPRGLAGQDIPLSGRIVAVVDYFDALTMDRCYRRAMPYGRVHGMLQDQRGRAFDPQVVDALLDYWPDFVALREHIQRVQPSFDDLVRGTLDCPAELESF